MPLIVALGDSMTSGFGLSSPMTQNYAALYAGRRHTQLINLAIPGSQCEDVLDNQVPRMPRGASVVILNCGVNDIGGFGFTAQGKPDGSKRTAPANDAERAIAQRDFHKVIAAIREREPQATILLVNIMHTERVSGPETAQYARDVDAWNAMLAATGLPVIDICHDERLYRPDAIAPDQLHLSARGHAIAASDFPP